MNVFWINEPCHSNLWVIVSTNTAEMRLMNYWHIYDWTNIFSEGNMFNHAVFINCKILEACHLVRNLLCYLHVFNWVCWVFQWQLILCCCWLKSSCYETPWQVLEFINSIQTFLDAFFTSEYQGSRATETDKPQVISADQLS